MTSDWQLFKRQLHRELTVYGRDTRQLLYACVFFLMMLVFFPLTISAEAETLRQLAPGLIWIDLLFAFFLSSERLFQSDYDEGIIEQWLVSGYSIRTLITAKLMMNWLLMVVPMLILSPLIGVFLHLSSYEILILMISIVCGTPSLLFLCGLAAAFSTGLKQKGILMALILFPLTIPVMIFGSSTLISAMQMQPIQGFLAILLALSLMTTGFLPWAISAVVRLSLSD